MWLRHPIMITSTNKATWGNVAVQIQHYTVSATWHSTDIVSNMLTYFFMNNCKPLSVYEKIIYLLNKRSGENPLPVSIDREDWWVK